MPPPGRPRNPRGEQPTRFHDSARVVVARAGDTPGLQDVEPRAIDTVAPGTIRRLWRQAVNFIPAPPAYSWTQNPPIITRALRYRASTLFRQAGTSNTRFGARRPIVPPRTNQRPVTLAAGNLQGRPAIRNRLTSFGRRVPTLNLPSAAAEEPTA